MEKVLCSSGSLTVEAPLSEHFFRHRWNKSLSTSGKLTGDWNQQVCRRNYYCENSAHPGVLTTSYKKQNRDFLIPTLPDATLPQENPAQHELRKMGMNWSSSSFHGSFFIHTKPLLSLCCCTNLPWPFGATAATRGTSWMITAHLSSSECLYFTDSIGAQMLLGALWQFLSPVLHSAYTSDNDRLQWNSKVSC